MAPRFPSPCVHAFLSTASGKGDGNANIQNTIILKSFLQTLEVFFLTYALKEYIQKLGDGTSFAKQVAT